MNNDTSINLKNAIYASLQDVNAALGHSSQPTPSKIISSKYNNSNTTPTLDIVASTSTSRIEKMNGDQHIEHSKMHPGASLLDIASGVIDDLDIDIDMNVMTDDYDGDNMIGNNYDTNYRYAKSDSDDRVSEDDSVNHRFDDTTMKSNRNNNSNNNNTSINSGYSRANQPHTRFKSGGIYGALLEHDHSNSDNYPQLLSSSIDNNGPITDTRYANRVQAIPGKDMNGRKSSTTPSSTNKRSNVKGVVKSNEPIEASCVIGKNKLGAIDQIDDLTPRSKLASNLLATARPSAYTTTTTTTITTNHNNVNSTSEGPKEFSKRMSLAPCKEPTEKEKR